jgi:putative ABC transport system permease protein
MLADTRNFSRHRSFVRDMDTLALDLRAATRSLVTRPALTLVAVLTLALGIGANTALFSVVHAVLLRPLPFRDPERLIHVTNRVVSSEFEITTGGDFLDWRDQSRLLSEIAAWSGSDGFTLQQGERPERLQGSRVSANFLAVLGVRPAQGRNFLPAEDRLQGDRSILVSQRLWARLFGAGTRLAGQSLRLDDQVYTIVGVLPGNFLFPRNPDVDVLKPLALDETVERGRRQMTLLQVIGRLAPGASLGPVRAELTAIKQRAEAAARERQEAEDAAGPGTPEPGGPGPGPGGPGGQRIIRRIAGGPGGPGGPGRPAGPPPAPETLLIVEPLREWLVGDIRPSLLMLLGSVACVLLIACANVANLLLARATARRQEIAVRTALGAGRAQIARLLLTESVLLALLGGAAGLLLAAWTLQPLVALMPPDLAAGLFRQTRIGLDGPVLLFTFLVASGTGLLFGAAPALAATRPDLQGLLKEGGRSGRQAALRGLLVAAEVAVAAVLLVVAGLLLRSFLVVQGVDPGFDADRVLSVQVDLDPKRYESPAEQGVYFFEAVRRASAVPGVEAATFASSVPLAGFTMIRRGVQAEDRPPLPFEEQPDIGIILAGPDYFRTLGIRIVRGRAFTEADRDGTVPVAIVSQTLARRLWGDDDPIGKRILGRKTLTVVGVAEDVKHEGVVSSSQRVALYQPFLQENASFGVIAVRSPGDPAALTTAVQRAIQSVDPGAPLSDVATLRERLRRSVADRRFQLTLFGGFALLALGLAAIGLYGVLAYTVGERTHEIGIRMALGAARGTVQTLVLRRGLLLAAAGVALGLLLSLPAGRLVRSSLFGIAPADPITYLLIPAVLLLVAALATWLPARRATRVDPVIALRNER